MGRTTDITEPMREIAGRAKPIGAGWGDPGSLTILKFLLKHYFDRVARILISGL